MPIKIPDQLPARTVLESENIFVMPSSRALQQDIRPLKLLLLNLMPTKIVTETQLLRCLSNTPLQIEVDFLHPATHQSKNTSIDHLITFYNTFDQIADFYYDGMIITGAPVEMLPFEDVTYWRELCEIMDWSRTHVYSTFHICWGAQAALYYHYGIPKYPLPQKIFGVYAHRVLDELTPLVRGFDNPFKAPHSRHTTVRAEDILRRPELQLLAVSDRAGLYLAATRDGRQIFVTGHSEYDAQTLALEYSRDREKNLSIQIPENYFPDGDPAQEPPKSWNSHAHLLYTNWLNYYVYQSTPYNLSDLGRGAPPVPRTWM